METVRKIFLKVNGVERMFICDPERDSLTDVLRRQGLTGAKIGCGTGQCGACTVILDGKVVRSCTRKIKNVPQYSEIITIEGIGTPTNLHPIQLAWIAYNGVQCGFCAPGFIVSAYGLLKKNLNPTREDVREWFRVNRNVCRCTGYQHQVNAVMAAAEVMRGEKTMEDLTYQIPPDGRIYGTGYPRPSAVAKVTGTCDYGDDINVKMPDGALHLALVLARVNHAKVMKVDFSKAEKMPGFVQAITYKDVKGTNRISLPSGMARCVADGVERPIMTEDTVYRYGDVIAIIAGTSRREARDAASKVIVEYDPLPEYMNALDAVAPDAQPIHYFPNLYAESPLIVGDAERAIEEADFVIESSCYTPRQPHLVIEPDTALSYIDEEGRVTVQSKSLDIIIAMGSLSDGLGVPPEKMRMIQNNTGASFGYAATPYTQAIMAVAAIATQRACCLTLDYEEHQHFTGKRMPCFTNVRLGCDKEGKLVGMEVEALYDKGAYTELTAGILKGMKFIGTPYTIPNASVLTKATVTNHNFTTAFRAFGSPQIYPAFEQAVDDLAEKAGIDPLEFRRRNVYKEGDVCSTGNTMDVYTMEQLCNNLKPRYLAAKERVEKHSTTEKRRGVGVACGVYHASAGPLDRSEAALELNSDGTVTCFNTWSDQGQGGDVGSLIHTHEALEPLGLRPDQIHLVQSDTAICPPSGGAYSSRSNVMVGNAILDAARQLLDAMKKTDGSWRTYDEMTEEGIPTKYTGVFDLAGVANLSPLDPNNGQGNFFLMYTYGLFMSEVEVDMATGKVKVLNMDMEADVGVVTNPQSLEGQAFGGFAQGIGFALSEDYEDMKRHTSLLACGVPTIDMVPDEMHVHHVETPRKLGPHGSGGAAELYLTAPHAAVLNAVHNACGIRVREMPATPSKILEELKKKAEGKQEPYEPYYLGADFHERIAEIKENPVQVVEFKGFSG